ncbi:helix-turn-helix transcriptional regulator [Aquimarina sp. 2201CG5-10]|uniref:helix-turn-helix transcriptional regulator n=1 Tax=Aquimarina callyspongiae TaxID=3098150 RepID=UPI002AB51395|nr:helix-turn-helix transcriptional regulator [Aquimarina sp. 2201CG5-10]MDY8137952.1 helix-turn-helix transcriptional regulator [Aquimarina sp. 2201CG5-10]
MRKFHIFLLLSILKFQFSFSQNTEKALQLTEESSFNAIEEKFNSYKQKDIKKAQFYGKIFLRKAKKLKDTSKIGRGYFLLANVFYKDTALIYADSAIAITKHKINLWQPAQAHLLKATLLAVNGNHKKAFDELENANRCANISGNIEQEYEIKYILSRLKTNVGDYESSIDILKEIISYYEKNCLECGDNIRGYIIANWAYLHNLNQLKITDSTEIIYKKIVPLSLKTKDSLMYIKLLLSSAITDYQKENYQPSLDSIFKLDQLLKKRGANIGTHTLKYLYTGKIYLKQKKYDLAIKNLKKVDSISLKGSYFSPSIRENYELLINYYKEQKDTKNQLFYIDRLLKADSIIDKDFAYLVKNSAEKYTTPNLLLEKQKIIDSLKNDGSNKKTIAFILLGSLALLTPLLIWNNKKHKLYKKRIAELGTPKKNTTYTIDDETTKRILDELSKIENSELFLKKDFNLAMVAKNLNTNTAYLSKIINQYKQKTFKQYLVELRINFLLKKLDKNPIIRKYSIEALAESIGYNNASSFTRIFKSYTGESPSSFLNKRYPDRNT